MRYNDAMPYRIVPLVSDHYYHVYNRGVEKRKIFSKPYDEERFVQMLLYYQRQGPKPSFSAHKSSQVENLIARPKIVEIICYSLMPNHFHFLLKQVADNGISEFIGKLTNSYTKYFNTKYDRVGPLLQGPFKAKLIETDEQLLHMSRYIHLNALMASLVKSLEDYQYSSYREYIGLSKEVTCFKDPILGFFHDPTDYHTFVNDQIDYAKQLDEIKRFLIDD